MSLRERGAVIKALLAAREKQNRAQQPVSRWPGLARPEQLPPPGDWFTWMIMAGRGFGKTRSGAEWVADKANQHPGCLIAVIGEKWTHTKKVPMEAIRQSLKDMGYKEGEKVGPLTYGYNKSELQITLPNGAQIQGFSAQKPDSLRGPNFWWAWCDELAHFPKASELWYQALIPAVRLGDRPGILVTTTPKPRPLIKELVKDDTVALVHGATWDNAANLAPSFLEQLRKKYDGTRIGRQELYGDLLLEAEGALWNGALIEAVQWFHPVPNLNQVIVSVDPSGSANGDATGIVTAGIDAAGVVYVMADDTCKGSPEHRYEQACKAAARSGAGVILYESAYGGDNIAHGLRSAWKHLAATDKAFGMVPRLEPSPTKSSKADRAHPVAALYEQSAHGHVRVRHTQPLPELEDELVQWEPSAGWSPNRMDAMVHAVRYLAGPGLAPAEIATFTSMPDLPPIPIG